MLIKEKKMNHIKCSIKTTEGRKRKQQMKSVESMKPKAGF